MSWRINGHFLGNHAYGFTPFWYDITPWIKIGENVLAVKADTSLVTYSRFYHGTGIYRPVWLISTNALHIEQWGVVAVTEASGEDSATVAVTTKVRVAAYPETKWFGFGAEPQQEVTKACTLETTIVDGDGRDVVTSTVTADVANYTSPVFQQTLTVPQPKLWSVDSPAMYSIRQGRRHCAHALTGISVGERTAEQAQQGAGGTAAVFLICTTNHCIMLLVRFILHGGIRRWIRIWKNSLSVPADI